jgi:hypothetical protein
MAQMSQLQSKFARDNAAVLDDLDLESNDVMEASGISEASHSRPVAVGLKRTPSRTPDMRYVLILFRIACELLYPL